MAAVYGIAGPSVTGKRTFAVELNAAMERAGHASSVTGFEDPIKAMLNVGLGLNEDQLYGDQACDIDTRYGVTPKHLMQSLRYEWGWDLVHPDLWGVCLRNSISANNSAGVHTIVEDIFYDEDEEMLRALGAQIIHIARPGFSPDEDQVEAKPGDRVVAGYKNIADLEDWADAIVAEDMGGAA